MSAPIGDDGVAVAVTSRPVRLAAVAVGVVVVGLVSALALSDGAASSGAAILGRTAPAIHGRTLDGQAVDLDEARGRWVLLNFFAPWCTECRVEHPELEALAQWGADGGELAVVSVVVDSSISETDAFLEDRPSSWEFVIDPDGRTSVEYGMLKVPETFLVAPDGVVVAKYSGAIEADAVRQTIRELGTERHWLAGS